MESTFVIARRSKCRQNRRQEGSLFIGPDRNRLPDNGERQIEPRHSPAPDTAAIDDDDDEIVLI